MSDALYDFAHVAFPLLELRIACRLRERRVPGMLDDVEDILNRLLEKVGNHASSFRGRCDAQAEKWLEKISESIINDARKTPLRRLRLFMQWLRGQGYHDVQEWRERHLAG